MGWFNRLCIRQMERGQHFLQLRMNLARKASERYASQGEHALAMEWTLRSSKMLTRYTENIYRLSDRRSRENR